MPPTTPAPLLVVALLSPSEISIAGMFGLSVLGYGLGQSQVSAEAAAGSCLVWPTGVSAVGGLWENPNHNNRRRRPPSAYAASFSSLSLSSRTRPCPGCDQKAPFCCPRPLVLPFALPTYRFTLLAGIPLLTDHP